MKNDRRFGKALKALRSALNLSQLALANRLGSTQRHVSFLETGRSRPSPAFLQRLCAELNLSAAQRGALFEASDHRTPYPRRTLSSDEVTDTLNMITCRILDNWPFPGFILNPEWTVLRMNAPARVMFSNFGVDPDNESPNLLQLLLSPQFRARILNWGEASQGLYFRMLEKAERVPEIRQAFDQARREGVFDHIPQMITGNHPAPIYVPLRLSVPGGPTLEMTSFVGQLATVQDAIIEGLEVELMVPLDDATDAQIRAKGQGSKLF